MPRPAISITLGLGCIIFSLLWVAFLLFFALDAIGDYREAHGVEVGTPISWTWRDTFHQVGGIPGIFFGLVPPAILLACGLYLSFTTIRKILHAPPPA